MLPEFGGFAIPAVDIELDQLNECEAPDIEAGDPALWPAWTDADRWEPEPEPFQPSPEDWESFHEWAREIDARDRDLEDAHREADYQAWCDEQSRYTDQDLQAAGLIPG